MSNDKPDTKSTPVSMVEAEAAIATFVATLESLVRKAPTTRRADPASRRRP